MNRLSDKEAIDLLKHGDILELGQQANKIRQEKHPGNTVTFIVDRNINYTNVCLNECRFCAFFRRENHKDAYLLPIETILQKVKETLENAGYAVENLVFQTSSLSADILREIENQYVAEGLLEESKRKPEWTNEDDVCIVYARQTVSGIPVYPELSVMAQALAYDTPESSPVVAVCSTRGIESLRVYGLYDFQEDGENVPLKGFDEIAATVETKYENLLDESTYTVTRAKFYERAYINEDQQYTAEPIWYLEINDDNSQKYVMLVNAETGKEIYLM